MKLIKLKKQKDTADSLVERKSRFGNEQDMELLSQCEVLWNNLRDFRRARARAIRFTYGDQWGEMINVNGKVMSQRQYLSTIGNVALQTNQIKRVVNTIGGTWVKEKTAPVCHARDVNEQAMGNVMTQAAQANWDRNDENILLSLCLEDLLIGGFCMSREAYEKRDGVEDSWTDICSPNDIFFESAMKDPRFKDLSLIGEIHDIMFNELCGKFVEKPEDYEKLREWYYSQSSPLKYHDQLDINERNDEERLDFYSPRDTKRCRVYEIWTKERRPRYHVLDTNEGTTYDINADDRKMIKEIEAENKARIAEAKKLGFADDEIPLIEYKDNYFMDEYWYCRYMTPTGYILWEGESPFPDKKHPYSLCAVPFINGKIVSYIADAIDQNIAINRILTLDDWIRRSGAKGVTFVPQNIIPDGMDYKTFAEQWTSIDGIVFYKPNNSGDKPFTEYGNVGTLNTAELVKMMSDLMESSVSVSGALQGKTPYSGTSAALYNQQTENSSTPIAGFMAKFDVFVKQVSEKKCKYIAANYDVDRLQKIAGTMKGIDMNALDLNEVGEIDFDYKMTQDAEQPTLRAQENQLLINLATSGVIGIEDALECGEFNCKDELIRRIAMRQQEMAAMPTQPRVGADYQQKKDMITGNV